MDKHNLSHWIAVSVKNRIEAMPKITRIGFPMATMPARSKEETSKGLSAAPGPWPWKCLHGMRIGFHCPFEGTSNDARYEEKGRVHEAVLRLKKRKKIQ
jgi:hypothetical protein